MNPAEEAIKDINLSVRIIKVLEDDRHGKLTKRGIQKELHKYHDHYTLLEINEALKALQQNDQVVRTGGWFQLVRDPPEVCERCGQKEMFHENRGEHFCPVCENL